MTAVGEIAPELAPYLGELVRRLSAVTELDAVYLFGSAAQGAYEHGRSDVDVIAVTARPSSREVKRALADAAESLPCPARKLELVHFSPDDDLDFWFVIDRAIAEQYAIPLLGPPWGEVFAPVPREAVLVALDGALAFDAWDDPKGAKVAAARARIWRETGEWVSKKRAAEIEARA